MHGTQCAASRGRVMRILLNGTRLKDGFLSFFEFFQRLGNFPPTYQSKDLRNEAVNQFCSLPDILLKALAGTVLISIGFLPTRIPDNHPDKNSDKRQSEQRGQRESDIHGGLPFQS